MPEVEEDSDLDEEAALRFYRDIEEQLKLKRKGNTTEEYVCLYSSTCIWGSQLGKLINCQFVAGWRMMKMWRKNLIQMQREESLTRY